MVVRRAARLALVSAALLLTGCGAHSEAVRAEDHRAFFLWAGVAPQPVLDRAEEVYLLDGEVQGAGRGAFVPLRGGVPRIAHAGLWLVVRTNRLDWDAAVWPRVLADLERWRAGGNRVIGLQIDFDAATRGLDRYAAFLADLRIRLPQRYRLSITGLMDWSANGDPAALARLKGTVDEVVIQTYQGRATIPGYADYVAHLARVPVPHKLALVQGGTWREPAAVRRDPLFRGYVVFLVNPAP
ncbi:MAG: DUF3142 domain-containing protein [Novosphingobium sp.]|uniref:DUF3142 domain-containing protein n=1 Tax=Novosphingobium sp. TaxID=1874826 RepID=UPI0032B82030